MRFFLDITGLRIGEFLIVASAVHDEPVVIVMFVVYAVSAALFIRKERPGRWLIFAVLIFWVCIQGSMYFRSDFSGYYSFFQRRGNAQTVC